MQGIKYEWKRFWCPRLKNISLSDEGYLYDPDCKWGHLYNPHVVSFESISKVQCLGLLGEPGSGKSHAIQQAKKKLEEDKNTLLIDLRSCGSEASLYRNLFDNPSFVAWIEGDYELHLFLDSLDECLLRIDYVVPLLIEELRRLPIQRLFLRISCRTAEWPNTFESELREIWGKENIEVLELAPLRSKDIKEALVKNNLDVEKFMTEVREKEVTSFAIKPVTFNFLLNQYRINEKLPSTQSELYLRGCELLCEETNENRITSRKKGRLTIRERLTIASRIAAITIFSNKYAIWKGTNFGNVPHEDVTLQELSDGGKRETSNDFVISENDIEETISTGLFTSRGINQLGWAHQTYAEFLAALYVIENKLSPLQIMTLIQHPEDKEGKLIPQLHEVSAWLASMNSDMFNEIVKSEPQVLLRSDIATANAKDKEILVSGLLEQYEEEKAADWDYEIKSRYFKLVHPNLVEQLKPYLLDKNKGIIVRRATILIAEACKLKGLLEELLNIALDPTEILQIRVRAAHFIGEVGDKKHKVKLIHLAKELTEDDPDDDLKGLALNALWPSYISIQELFSLITPIKRINYLGPYKMFLNHTLLNTLQTHHLPCALKWVEDQPSMHELDDPYDDIVNYILKKSWLNLDMPGILPSFAAAVLSRLKYYDTLSFADDLQNSHQKRRNLILNIITSKQYEGNLARTLINSPLFTAKDLTWMVDNLLSTNLGNEQKIWAELIYNNFSISIPSEVELVYNTARESQYLEALVRDFFGGVQLSSLEAKKLKERYLIKKMRNRKISKPSSNIPNLQTIIIYLDDFDSGDLDSWWKLNYYMAISSDGIKLNEFEPDLTTLFGWGLTDGNTKNRIIAAARSFILYGNIDAEMCFTHTIYRPAHGGFRAFKLLLNYDQEFVLNLSKDVWRKWIPAIMTYPTITTNDSEKTRNELIGFAYAYNPEEVIKTLLRLVDAENVKSDYLFITRAVEGCWDNKIGIALLSKVKENDLKNKFVDSILHDLLKHKVEGAIEFTKSLISNPLPVEEKKRETTIIAARQLLTKFGKTEWDNIWEIIKNNPQFGREVIISIANNENGYGEIINLPEKNIADLYIWLVQQFPFEEDPKYENERMAHFIGSREQVAEFRDMNLRLLKNKGTFEACNEIKRISKEFPKFTELKWTLLEAQSTTRRYTWLPPKPVDIINLAINRNKRFVQNGEQLLDVLIDSLNRLEKKLHGETPAVPLLWNHLGKEKYKPRTENEFSDYVKQHLTEDLTEKGIIVNREVEIRRTYGINKGERTDIQVNAVSKDREQGEYQTVSVIIEVKGNWHPELSEAMETQLVNRYLKDNTCTFGLYLIGWFLSESWEVEHRKKRIPKVSIEEARNLFDKQAETLSNYNRKVKAYVMNLKL